MDFVNSDHNPDIDHDMEYLMSNQDFRMREETLKNAIEMSDAAIRMAENPDFKKVIIDLYLTLEPARLAGMFAAPLPDGQHQHVSNDIMGIGKLKLFLSMLTTTGIQARSDLEELRGYVQEHGLSDG